MDGWELAFDAHPEKALPTTAEHRTGTGALELKYGEKGSGVQQQIAHAIPDGGRVKLSAWVLMPRAGSRENKLLTFELQGFDNTGKYLWNTTTFNDPRFLGPYPEWTRLEFFPANLAPAAEFRIFITTGNGNGNGPDHSVFVDDVEAQVFERSSQK